MAAKQNKSYVCPPKSKSFKIPKAVLNEELEVIRERREAVSCESSDEAQAKANSEEKKEEAQPDIEQEKDDVQNDAKPDPQEKKSKLKKNLVGLALSGGGIRSATFSLGVLQRLAKEDCLKHVDYLSTVSGGGYIGGSLTWLLSDKAKNLRVLQANEAHWDTSANFPYGVKDPREERRRKNESKILKHLRLHGKYLIPGKGITTTSLIAVILRGILLNLLVWLPLLVALMVVLMFVSCAIWHIESFGEAISSWDAIWSDIKESCLACTEGELDLLLYLAGLIGGVFLIVSTLYSLSTRKAIFKGSYLKRRKFEKCIRWPIWIGLSLLVVGSLPVVKKWLGDYLEEVGAVSVLLAIVSGVLSFRSDSNGKGKIPLGVLAPLVSIPFFYGLALASYKLALLYLGADPAWIIWVLLGGSVFIPFLTGWCVNLNYISIHRYYRDRLMEAFMPCPNTDGKPAAAKDADKAALSDMWSKHALDLTRLGGYLMSSKKGVPLCHQPVPLIQPS